MPTDQVSPGSARLLAVAIGTYEHYPPLTEAVPVAEKLVALFTAGGFVQDHPDLVGEHVSAETIKPAITEWLLQRQADDQLLAYWAGHGLTRRGDQLLLAATNTPTRFRRDDGVDLPFILDLLTDSPAKAILLIVDTCFSGQAGVTAMKYMADIITGEIPPPDMVGKRFGVMTTSHPRRTVTSPVVGAALVNVLSDPETGSTGWGRRDARIGLRQLQKALTAQIATRAHVHVAWNAWEARRSGWDHDDGAGWLPNPVWLGRIPDEVVEIQRTLLGLTTAGAHWDLSHRGIEVGSSGWAFVGRHVTLARIVKWLASSRNGVLVVTGPPGSGKSAVVGRLVTLSVEAYRERTVAAGILTDVPKTTLPAVGVFNAAVHARDKTLLDVILHLIDAFDVKSDEAMPQRDLRAATEALQTHLLRSGEQGQISTIAIDALDEARANHAKPIAEMCHDLGQIPGVRVLVGVRYSISGEPVPHGTAPHALLKEVWPDGMIVDLAKDPDTPADLARYVEARLARRHPNTKQRRTLAKAIADRAMSGAGYFLYARIVARTLQESETLPAPGDLPQETTQAFAEDLLKRFGEDRARFDDLLGALAWAFGSGFPKTVWAQVASAISSEGAAYETGDVNDLLRRAGWHIIESDEDQQSVYRLGHELLNEYYRGRQKGRGLEASIPLAICDGVDRGGGWGAAAPYAVRYLGLHFPGGPTDGVQGSEHTERLLTFCTDPLWLKRAVQLVGVEGVINLLNCAYQLTEAEDLNVLARVLRRSRVAVSRDVSQLAAQLHLRLADTNLPHLRGLVEGLESLAPAIWLRSRGRLLGWHDDLETTYTVTGTVRALTFGEVEGATILAIAVDDRVILWDPKRGTGEERVIQNPGGRVTGLSIEYLEGRPVLVVAAGYDGNVVVRDFWTGEQIGPTYTGCEFVDSVTVGLLRGQRTVAAAGSSRLWTWDQQSGAPVDGPAKLDETWKIAGVLAFRGSILLSLYCVNRPRPEVVGFDALLVDAASGQPMWPQTWSNWEPRVMATAVLPRGLVSAAQLAIEPGGLALTTWLPAATDHGHFNWDMGHPIGTSTVRALAVGEVDGRLVAAFAPDYHGSGFVQLRELESYKTIRPSNTHEPEPFDPGDVYLPDLDIWAVARGDSDEVQVLASRPELIVLNVRSGSSYGLPADLDPVPEFVSALLAQTILRDSPAGSQPAHPAFSTVQAGQTIPIRPDDGQADIGNAPPSNKLVRLRKGEPEKWPATAVSRGILDGRAVLVCGSYGGAIWIWDLEKGTVLGGPFADIPDEIQFRPGVKMAAGAIPVTADVAVGEVEGDSVVAAAVDGKVKQYDVRTGASLPEPAVSTSIVVAVALGRFEDRSILITGSRGGVLAVWEAGTARRLTGVTLDSGIDGVWMVNGADAIAARSGGSLFIFDLVRNDAA